MYTVAKVLFQFVPGFLLRKTRAENLFMYCALHKYEELQIYKRRFNVNEKCISKILKRWLLIRITPRGAGRNQLCHIISPLNHQMKPKSRQLIGQNSIFSLNPRIQLEILSSESGLIFLYQLYVKLLIVNCKK